MDVVAAMTSDARGPLLRPAVRLVLIAALLAAGGLAWGLANREGAAPGLPPADDPGPVHVHGLGLNPADERVYVATHTGLWRLASDGVPERVGDTYADFMGFSVVGPDHFLASGHPDLRTDLPPLLGLIESRDGGVTWQSVSRLGVADFHALRAAHDRVYGWSSTDGTFSVSADGTEWERRATVSVIDFVVDPADPDRVLASSAESLDAAALVASGDGGRTWGPVEGPGVERLSWEAPDRLFGVDARGRVWRSRDGGGSWEQAGAVEGRAGALLDTGDALYAAAGSAIVRSTDDGATWTVLFRPDAEEHP
ncbi:MAG TPA: hypothetical protein VNU01_13115 [Egibacteraceae bacterium]|nr:hypothetical protein [Egibacteraceae bacterium]